MNKVSQVLNQLRTYRDQYSLLTQKDRDGGDTANRTGQAYVYMAALGLEFSDLGGNLRQDGRYELDLLRATKSIQTETGTVTLKVPGRYVRHPDYKKWYSNPENFSRDQSVNVQSMMSALGLSAEAKQLFKARSRRAFFHFNDMEGDDTPGSVKYKFPDPPSPIEFAQFIRATRSWFLYPLLMLLDLQLVIEVLVARPIVIRNGNTDLDSQLLPLMISSLLTYKTPAGLLARYIYSKADVPNKLRFYFGEANNRNGLAPLGELGVLAFNKVIKEEE
jgi:hypothetical protein